MDQERKLYLNSINYFRVFAISSIVIMHCYYKVDIPLPEKLYNYFRTLIDGGTHYFVFISGVLFHYLFYPSYTYKSFYMGRVQRVFIPYLFMGIPLIFIYVFIEKGPLHDMFFSYEGNSQFLYYAIPFMKYFFTGRMLLPYWYIPFIMVFYLFSFSFIPFIKLNFSSQILLILFMLCLSMVIHRAYFSLNVLQNVVYFAPVYLSGIFYSLHRTKINIFLTNNKRYLLLFGLSLVTMYVHVFVFKKSGSSFKYFWLITVPDLLIISKLLISFSTVALLSRFDNVNHQKIWLLDQIAKKSFAIFFLHQFFIEFAARYGLIRFIPFFGISKLLLFTLIVIALSILSAYFIRLIFQKYSKYLIGW
jgi:probable poly-beta-1,6-N-acetyl-D-glucosamine export protein